MIHRKVVRRDLLFPFLLLLLPAGALTLPLVEIAPADVHAVATLLVSEVAYLHDRTGARDAREIAGSEGAKTPSHAYQSAGRLQAQLAALERDMGEAPAAPSN